MTTITEKLVQLSPVGSTMSEINASGNNTIITGDGDDTIIAFGSHNTIEAGAGDDDVGVVGDDLIISLGEGDDNLAFWSNNSSISLGSGDNVAMSLDLACEAEGLATPDFIKHDTHTTTGPITSQVTTSSVTSATQSSGNLSKVSQNEIAALGNDDIQTVLPGGIAKYVIAPANDGAYHIYQYNPNNPANRRPDIANIAYTSVVPVAMGSNYLWVGAQQFTPISSGAQQTVKTTTQNMQTTKVYGAGLKNNTIVSGSGDDSIALTGSNTTIVAGNGDNRIAILAPNLLSESQKVVSESFTLSTIGSIARDMQMAFGTTSSPLILDTNKDGKVDAKSGIGVDIDNNGVADGAAIGGDKMVAMGDLNGNGVIDGTEVFGNKTINPFTGQALNAANGFDALKMVAEDAEKISGLDVYKDGQVNLNLLKAALEANANTSLGLISDNNVTSLEGLGDAASINVEDYTEQAASGDVQHKQLGSYTDTTGNTYKTDDVWFTLLKKLQK
ncbi:MAG: hypothetical protein WC197_08485 [Candidatus Gastranaerophilaceae bacterium]